jgi:hypothetical protein
MEGVRGAREHGRAVSRLRSEPGDRRQVDQAHRRGREADRRPPGSISKTGILADCDVSRVGRDRPSRSAASSSLGLGEAVRVDGATDSGQEVAAAERFVSSSAASGSSIPTARSSGRSSSLRLRSPGYRDRSAVTTGPPSLRRRPEGSPLSIGRNAESRTTEQPVSSAPRSTSDRASTGRLLASSGPARGAGRPCMGPCGSASTTRTGLRRDSFGSSGRWLSRHRRRRAPPRTEGARGPRRRDTHRRCKGCPWPFL